MNAKNYLKAKFTCNSAINLQSFTDPGLLLGLVFERSPVCRKILGPIMLTSFTVCRQCDVLDVPDKLLFWRLKWSVWSILRAKGRKLFLWL
jgi:hypothetical protein